MPAIDRNLLPKEGASLQGQIAVRRIALKAVPETDCTISCVCDWLHAPSQSLPIRFRSSRPFFGEFEGSESEVGRTDEFRGPRDAGNNVSTSLSSGLKKSNGDSCSGCFWHRSGVSLHDSLPLSNEYAIWN